MVRSLGQDLAPGIVISSCPISVDSCVETFQHSFSQRGSLANRTCQIFNGRMEGLVDIARGCFAALQESPSFSLAAEVRYLLYHQSSHFLRAKKGTSVTILLP